MRKSQIHVFELALLFLDEPIWQAPRMGRRRQQWQQNDQCPIASSLLFHLAFRVCWDSLKKPPVFRIVRGGVHCRNQYAYSKNPSESILSDSAHPLKSRGQSYVRGLGM